MSLNEIIESLNEIFAEMDMSGRTKSSKERPRYRKVPSRCPRVRRSKPGHWGTFRHDQWDHRAIKANAENAAKAKEISLLNGQTTAEGKVQMDLMIKAMDEISNASNKIGKIIENIDDIAFQTNILALNAAVEAARPVQRGKALPLSRKKWETCGEIGGECQEHRGIDWKFSGGHWKRLENRNGNGESFEKIAEGNQRSDEVIQEIADASEEQAKAADQVNIGMEQISGVVQTNSATAEESAVSEELFRQAQMLKELIRCLSWKRKTKIPIDKVSCILAKATYITKATHII